MDTRNNPIHVRVFIPSLLYKLVSSIIDDEAANSLPPLLPTL